ncbi:MAG: aminotransferase class III-fold pyridoxal phosphate-dependent enzyme [Bdellovibrionaceae bacterium]|nr:aminotransferase class III-fold pyridoxal phosphate-dependent enzyme [Pseudobdellovibrionaceae bacterium]
MNSLVGQQIDTSSKVESLIKDLVQEVAQINAQIKSVQAPQSDFAESGKSWVEKTGQFRGRPLFYAYVGTGAGRGPFVELEDGSIKLDLINGIGIHLMGHGNPRVMQAAVRGALSDIVTQGNLQPNREYQVFTEKLVKLAGRNSRLKYAWLSTCGTMANENALKISRQKNSPARMVVSFKNAFAGRSTMMAEVTDNPAYKVGLPEYNEVLRIPFFDKRDPQSSAKALAALKEHVAKHEKNISVFSFEPMLGEGGFQPAPREFFVPLLDFCKEKGIAIWADEVQTFSRTGELFAFETLGLGQYIDICTLAKTAQVGATLYTEEYNPKPGLIAGTFSGASVSLSVGAEILDMLQEGFLGKGGRISQIHERFISKLNHLNETTCKGKVQDAGGMGLMVAFTPFEGKKEQTEALTKKLFNNGLIGFTCGKDPVRVRFLVPAIIQDQEIDLAIKIVEQTILEGV